MILSRIVAVMISLFFFAVSFAQEGNKAVYTGERKEGRFHGKGRLDYEDGDYLESTFVDGLMNGPTELKIGDKYFIGTIVNNKMEGYGTMIWDNGDRYDGFYKNNFREGSGQFTFANGNVYIGAFREGYMSGQGVLIKKTEPVNVEGEFRKGDPYNAKVTYQGQDRLCPKGTVLGVYKRGNYKKKKLKYYPFF